MNEIYVAQEVVKKRVFDGYAFAHDLIGCRTYNYYYIKEELVFIVRDKETGFLYLDGREKHSSISPVIIEELYNNTDVLSCNQCNKHIVHNQSDCNLEIDTTEEVIGITNIKRLKDFTKSDDIDYSVKIIVDYNEKVKNKQKIINNTKKKRCKTKHKQR